MRLAYDIFYPSLEPTETNLPPVVMLHGMLECRKSWAKCAPQLAKHTGRKVYTVDARNHGDSPWSDDMTYDIMTDDLDEFLTQHGLQKVALVGHSMGGRTAMTMAMRQPEKIEKLVVVDMNLRNSKVTAASPTMKLLQGLKVKIQELDPEMDETSVKKTMIDYIKPGLEKLGLKSDTCYYNSDMMPLKKENGAYSWKTNMDVLETTMFADKLNQTLSGVYDGDTILFYGTNSFFRANKDELFAKHFPCVKKIKFEGCLHFLHLEDPLKFLMEVTNFLNTRSIEKSSY